MIQGNSRSSRTRKRRTRSLRPHTKHSSRKNVPSGKVADEVLELVRDGVEKFILKNATVEDFFNTVHAVSEKERVYSHQLTGSVLARIVKEAVRKRNLGRVK